MEEEYISKTNRIKYRPFKKTVAKSNLTYDDLCKKAMNVLNYCSRTRAQLFNTLKEYGGNEKEIDFLLDELEKIGLINDKEYVIDFIEQSIKIKKIGPKKIKQNLYEKGISSNLIEEALEKYTYDMQLKVAEEFINKKMFTIKKNDIKKQRQKITASLINRGFGYNVINEVITLVLSSEDDECFYY